MKRLVCLILIIFIFCGIFTGCFDRREVDDLAYVLSIGIDKGKTNVLKMTFQIAKPQAGGGGEDSGGGGDKAFTIQTIETPTIYSGLNIFNTFVGKQVNISHAKVIVISKELAQQGIQSFMHAIIRDREFRPNINIIVARDSAEDYIKSVKPELVLNPAKYYELAYSSYSYTGLSANSQMHNFYIYSESLYRQPVAILAGVGKFESSKDFTAEDSTYKEKGRSFPYVGDFKAGDITKTGGPKSENMGLAVFDGDKMVGELDGEEATYHLMSCGEYGYSYLSFPDPKVKDKFVLLNVKQSRQPQHKVNIVDGKPEIHLKVILESDILSIQSTINYEEENNLGILETSVEDFLKNGILKYLNKCSKEYKSDICGFGAHAKMHFLTWKDWENFNWKNKFKDSSFTVDIDFKVRRPGIILRTLPSESSEGKVEIK